METTFPNRKYTSIEAAELERLRAQASKGSMAPHVFAQMVNRVRDLAFDFGTCEQFRDRVSELLGEYIDPDAKAPIPPWDTNLFAQAHLRSGSYMEGDIRAMFYWARVGYNHAISRHRSNQGESAGDFHSDPGSFLNG